MATVTDLCYLQACCFLEKAWSRKMRKESLSLWEITSQLVGYAPEIYPDLQITSGMWDSGGWKISVPLPPSLLTSLCMDGNIAVVVILIPVTQFLTATT